MKRVLICVPILAIVFWVLCKEFGFVLACIVLVFVWPVLNELDKAKALDWRPMLEVITRLAMWVGLAWLCAILISEFTVAMGL